ncbi:hydrogen peroxide-inducible genes activator [Donghicola eburneus]|jgi:LysR family hydrogen peroxide-inducible transcriptional activator|uniref:LysR family transcriptional regulator n=1 Tax=Donghicola eburneus TaxID=393278 RepID=A0A1M4MXV7_9RHOB|nr:hydrogen peroxide-inducible genes activator [Donghicola eburneus]SCM66597.1 LysR family transcriptional regulator [Donghicola eburneus]
MFTLRQMRFLVALADTLNFSQAAEVCFVTQPTLSAGIKELEAILGVQLFERTKRSVLLTAVGAEVADRARRLLLDAGEIVETAEAHRNPFQGDLRLGAIPTIGPFLIPPAMPEIRKALPEIRLFLREEMTEALIEGLQAGRLDIILIALPFETGNLHIAPLFQDGYHLAAPPDWPAPTGTGARALEQAKGQLMLLEKGHCLQRHALAAYPGLIASDELDDFAATSLATLIAMVSEGLGITLLPDLAVAAGVARESFVRLTPLPDACPRQVVLAWRTGSARAAVYEKLAGILRNNNQVD